MAALSIVPNPSSLRDYVAEVETLAQCVEALDATDELSPAEYEAIQQALICSITAERSKVDRVAAALSAFEAAAEAAAKEAARLTARKQRHERSAERLRHYVLVVLSTSNLKKLEGHTSTLQARTNPPSVWIDDATAIPEMFLRTPKPPAPAPDKTAIAQELKRGNAVPGCRLAQSERLEVK